jgi:hypothetical protein
MNSTPPRRISWLNNPCVSFRLCFLQLDEVSVELIELRRQHISVRDKVVLFAAELLLGLDEIEAESVFACDLVTHREVIYPLELVESLVQEGLA